MNKSGITPHPVLRMGGVAERSDETEVNSGGLRGTTNPIQTCRLNGSRPTEAIPPILC